jgi:hypothetical protein
MFAFCFAGALIFSVIAQLEAAQPTADAQEIAVRQTADTIVQENAIAVVTLTALAKPQNTETPTAIPQPTERPRSTEVFAPSATGTVALPSTEVVTPRPTVTDTPRLVYAIGETIRTRNWEFKVNKIHKAQTLMWGNPAGKADATGTFLLVYMTLKNIGNQNLGLDARDVKLQDAGGTDYTTSNLDQAASFIRFSKLANFGDPFPPGIPLNAVLIFDLAPTANGLQLYVEQTQVSLE